MKYVFVGFIRLYQLIISPIIRPNCRYVPSCSNYAINAVKMHGAFKGAALGFYRILRCNHFSKGGFDPVPDNYGGDIKWVL